MTFKHLLFVALATSAVSACAKDPYQDVKAARIEQAEAQRESRVEAAEENKERKLDSAQQRFEQREERADGFAKGKEEVATAHAAMDRAREEYRARAVERLNKASARLDEARTRLDIAGGRAPLETRQAVETAATQRQTVAGWLEELRRTQDTKWQDSTTRVDKGLEELETLVERAHERAKDLR